MTNALRIEGRAQLDGLFSGPLRDEGDSLRALRAGLLSAAEQGLILRLDVDGGRFHLLADNTPFAAGADDLPRRLETSLVALLEGAQVPLEACESTLRLRAWTPGEEHQTLFVLGSGDLRAVTRSVDCETELRASDTSKSWGRRSLEFAVMAAGACLLWFLLQQKVATDWSSLDVDLGPYGEHLHLEQSAASLTLERKEGSEALSAAWRAAAPGSLEAFVLEDLLRSRLRYRLLDARGQVLGPAWRGLVLGEGPVPLLPSGGSAAGAAVRLELLP